MKSNDNALALQFNSDQMSSIAHTLEALAGSVEEFKRKQREELEQLKTRMARPGAMLEGGPARNAETLQRAATAEERRSFVSWLRTGDQQALRELRAAVNVGTSGQGLEAVAPWFGDQIRNQARAASPLLQVLAATKAASFPAKFIVGDVRSMTSQWSTEQATRNGTDAPLPLVVEIAAGEWSALPSVTEWAIGDVSFDLEQWLSAQLVAEYAESLQEAVVTGNGSGKPTGFLAGPTPVTTADALRAFGTLQYIATGQAATLPTTTSATVDLLLDVVHTLRWQHRQNATWVANAATLSTLRKFKDADNRPILLDSMITGQPARLLGYPVIECEAMPAIAANAFPLAFGDFNAGYQMVEDATGMRFTRDEITTKGFVKFYARCRVGGKILDSEAIKLVKVAAS